MIKSFFNYEIEWKQDKVDETIFSTIISGNSLYLRMNDFPSEPLYTFIFLREELDFDDLPEKWTIKFLGDPR